MSRVRELFIRPLTSVLTVRAADPDVLFEDLEETLKGYPDAVLTEAAKAIRRRRPREGYYRDASTFPTVAECVDWCAAFMPTRTAAPVVPDRNEAAANAAIRSPLGERAVREGWINQLWDHHCTHERAPREDEIPDLQRAAAEMENDLKMSGAVARIFNRSVIAKRDRLTAIVNGEKV